MINRRSGLGPLWLYLSIQTAAFVSVANSNEAATEPLAWDGQAGALLSDPADDAFVFVASASVQAAPVVLDVSADGGAYYAPEASNIWTAPDFSLLATLEALSGANVATPDWLS